MRKKAFTLMELIIVVIIVAILAAIGLPFYFKAVERARVKEAISQLKLIQAAEDMRLLETNHYLACSESFDNSGEGMGNSNANCNTVLNLRLDTTEDRSWDFSVACDVDAGADGQCDTEAFTAYADRTGEGTYKDCQFSVNQVADPYMSSADGTCP